jgi:molybdopterin-guanine dinucleotide biosynthesis protein A
VYYQPVDELTAFILAGGKSTRMGRDKAFLEIEGRSLLERALALAGTVAGETVIVGDATKFSPWGRVLEDVFRERGPLGGIHAALAASKTEYNLVLAVDMPFLEARFLQYLVAEAKRTQAVVTVPRAEGGLQPLCAVYRRQFAGLAEQALLKMENKIDALFTRTETHVIGESELANCGFSGKMFHNVNTPQDLEREYFIEPKAKN